MKFIDLKNIKFDMKQLLNGFNSRVDIVKERFVNILIYW